jgi:hypothetical protein
MKLLLLILLSSFASASSGYRYGIPDYPVMYREADLVAIVRFVGLKDTQKKKMLDDVFSKPTGLYFRELNGTVNVISLLKGDVDLKSKLICRFYRFSTLEESSVDLGDSELARKRLAARFRNWGKIHVFTGPPEETENFEMTDFLVYLKKTSDGFYIPVTGDSDSDSAIRELSRPNVAAKLTNQAEQGGTEQPATRSQSKSGDSQKPQPEAEGRSR